MGEDSKTSRKSSPRSVSISFSPSSFEIYRQSLTKSLLLILFRKDVASLSEVDCLKNTEKDIFSLK